MYSPKIHDSLIPCLYHAAHEQKVPMTKMADAFIYHGLVSGGYGQAVISKLPEEKEIIHPNLCASMVGLSPPSKSMANSSFKIDQFERCYQAIRAGLSQAHPKEDSDNSVHFSAYVALEQMKNLYTINTGLCTLDPPT